MKGFNLASNTKVLVKDYSDYKCHLCSLFIEMTTMLN